MPESRNLEIARNLKLSGREMQSGRGTYDDLNESALAANDHIAPGMVHTQVERLHHMLVAEPGCPLRYRRLRSRLCKPQPI